MRRLAILGLGTLLFGWVELVLSPRPLMGQSAGRGGVAMGIIVGTAASSVAALLITTGANHRHQPLVTAPSAGSGVNSRTTSCRVPPPFTSPGGNALVPSCAPAVSARGLLPPSSATAESTRPSGSRRSRSCASGCFTCPVTLP